MTKLDEMIGYIRNGHVFIQTHNFPDPDAISTAFGLQRLLSYRNIDATICYKGKIDRYNTNKLIELLDIRLMNLSDIEDGITEKDEVILVDAQKGNSNIIDMPGTEIICIDHHPASDKVQYSFADIRPEYGACATIMAEYFMENDIPMDTRTATALSYGIRSDTDRLSRGTCKSDLEMLYRMYDRSDQSMIHMLENRELYFEDLMAYSKAIENIRVVDNVSFASAGENCPEALIASISDFMLELVEVEFSVVYAVQKNGIKLSVRSECGGYDAGKIIAKALEGIGNGGGHAAMAGGFIPMEGREESVGQIILLVQKRVLSEIQNGRADRQQEKTRQGEKTA